MSSDAHDDDALNQQLSKAMLHVSKIYGEKYAEKIFSTNQKSILDNKISH